MLSANTRGSTLVKNSRWSGPALIARSRCGTAIVSIERRTIAGHDRSFGILNSSERSGRDGRRLADTVAYQVDERPLGADARLDTAVEIHVRFSGQKTRRSAWILMDFRCPRRFLSGVQDYYNRKGLFSDRGEKKAAYYVLRDFYHSLAAASR
jgi:hypothetical protein